VVWVGCLYPSGFFVEKLGADQFKRLFPSSRSEILNAPPECKPQGGRGFVFLFYAQSFALCNQYLNG